MPVLIAKSLLFSGGKVYKKGRKLTVTDTEAKKFVARGWATLEVEKAPEVAPNSPPAKRTYKRKDIQTAAPLVVEPAAPLVVDEVPEVPAFRWPSRDDGE
jgi:hypothetical protein